MIVSIIEIPKSVRENVDGTRRCLRYDLTCSHRRSDVARRGSPTSRDSKWLTSNAAGCATSPKTRTVGEVAAEVPPLKTLLVPRQSASSQRVVPSLASTVSRPWATAHTTSTPMLFSTQYGKHVRLDLTAEQVIWRLQRSTQGAENSASARSCNWTRRPWHDLHSAISSTRAPQ